MTPEQLTALLRNSGGSSFYLVGAGGCGLSALGHLLLDLGHHVAGSDAILNEAVLQLRARGAHIHIGHNADQVAAARPNLVVYSSAIRLNNSELVAAQQHQIPIVRRADLLAAILRQHRGICVAGMHGKTTTAAMLSFALAQLNANPSYAIGAQVPQLPRPARIARATAPPEPGRDGFHSVPGSSMARPTNEDIRDAVECVPTHFSFKGTMRGSVGSGNSDPKPQVGDGETTGQAQTQELNAVSSPASGWFVVEADESDGTLREFHPEHAIVLNVDEEHLDYFANLDAVCREFLAFAEQTSGHLIFCADDSRLAQLFAQRRGALSFGFHPLAAYRIAGVKPLKATALATPDAAGGSTFEMWRHGERLGEFAIQLLGEKNVSNAAAVIALLHQMGYTPEAIARAIAPFRGAARRLQRLFQDDRFAVFDDYGHHPSEISASLQALKTLGRRRLLAAFQPHRFTRTQFLLQQFASCFALADRSWLTEIYAANETEIPGINGRALADAVRAHGQKVEFIPFLEDLGHAVRRAMQPGDLVLFLGAGDITKAAHQLADELRQESPARPERLLAELSARLSPATVLNQDEPLAKRTTLRVGGTADLYVEPASEPDLAEVLRFSAARKLPFVLLGRGSNLLIKDGGIRGLVVSLAHPNFCRVEVLGERLHCGAGAKLKSLAAEARRRGLTGLEFLEGIPGTVGGALRMNAGAMGSWIFEAVESIRFMDFGGEIHERKASEVYVEYRGCPLFKNHIALGAVLRGQPAPREAIEQKMSAFSQKRWHSQPAASSAGCIFKNPKSIPAGRLIDELGLKGTRVGGAVVSDVHGNFIVNDGKATAEDVLRLIEIIRHRAREARGIELETEVEIIGE